VSYSTKSIPGHLKQNGLSIERPRGTGESGFSAERQHAAPRGGQLMAMVRIRKRTRVAFSIVPPY
jgi:hypothetical protein